MDENELKTSKKTFKAIDKDYSGLISPGELKKALSHTVDISDEDINKIIMRVDYDNNGEINYSEFLSSTIDEDNLSEHNLYELFKYLDVFNKGFLTKESFTKTFQRAGKNISEEMVIIMLQELNINPE